MHFVDDTNIKEASGNVVTEVSLVTVSNILQQSKHHTFSLPNSMHRTI